MQNCDICVGFSKHDFLYESYISSTGPALGMLEVFGQTGPPNFGDAIFQTALLTVLPYFLPSENNDIVNVSLSDSQKCSNFWPIMR